ncbi:aldehyde dehydrogenase family protein [Caenispirillum bisanense]|uniref:Acyl-CoA reductase n=1 Tax=Caenispirillum bisanense TaxID=414052 RepID=A0A286GZA4_9PROT|nr:aldehyde dehydrogenase family protein [Caenispirillum bisanense]SOE00536.1 Acyl-CoA reductase [Caenispirillum bisanense]
MPDDESRSALAVSPVAEVARRLAVARGAQATWAVEPVKARLRVVRRLRRLIAREAEDLAALVHTYAGRAPAETLAAEILPLVAACRFLEGEAEALLAPRRLGAEGRPRWLAGVTAEVRRDALGVVLVIAPGNYPLMLPGIQMIQALAAGNAVAVKPPPQGSVALLRLAALLDKAGLPDGLVQVLGEGVAEAEAAIAAGVDKVVLTGSVETGRAVLRRLAEAVVPATMELSGSDAVIVLPGADLDLVARSVAYGLRLNAGATCIAPRRIVVPRDQAAELEARLLARLAEVPPAAVPLRVRRQAATLVRAAVEQGARLATPPFDPAEGAMAPVLVADAHPSMELLQSDVFAPVTTLVAVADAEAALRVAHEGPYGLGASVFGPRKAAEAVAARLRVGSVTVNDLIVPTADPRLPFGGRGWSGFGATRGPEGLLEMTRPKAISVRRGRFRPHLRPPRDGDARLFALYLRLAHGGWRGLLGR